VKAATRRRHFPVVLAAGGTGGHMFPAHVLAEELLARGHEAALITDSRGLRFISLFDNIPSYEVPSATFRGGILRRLAALGAVVKGIIAARHMLKRIRPAVVIGFGGYPSLPTVLAAMTLGIPTCLHEQNAVLGRVNRALAGWVRMIALSFENTHKLPAGRDDFITVTGNPVRSDVVEIAHDSYPRLDDGQPFHLLVLGGSQGASILSHVVPGAISALPKALRRRLQIVQQCREEDLANVADTYREFGVKATLSPFIENLPNELAKAHLVISRAGASTVTELAAAGRPSVLVPLPSATDDHQSANAAELASAGGAWIIPEEAFSIATLAKRLQNLANNPDRLTLAAGRALKVAKPRATQDLANLVEQVAIAGGLTSEMLEEMTSDRGNNNATSNGAGMTEDAL
jgi:UDP-N-acetylglucosamine--N-acetylmuramyl-(pentapeptide) pyrophosphoryl-undecaprenol N-acetylglucosamine transferase